MPADAGGTRRGGAPTATAQRWLSRPEDRDPTGRQEQEARRGNRPAASWSRGSELRISHPQTRPPRAGRAAQLPEDHSVETRATPVDEVTKE